MNVVRWQRSDAFINPCSRPWQGQSLTTSLQVWQQWASSWGSNTIHYVWYCDLYKVGYTGFGSEVAVTG